MDKIKPGTYRHYKGQLYEVIGEAHHSETLEEMVVYIALYETRFGKGSWWVRPKRNFLEKVRIADKEMPRFELMKEKE